MTAGWDTPEGDPLGDIRAAVRAVEEAELEPTTYPVGLLEEQLAAEVHRFRNARVEKGLDGPVVVVVHPDSRLAREGIAAVAGGRVRVSRYAPRDKALLVPENPLEEWSRVDLLPARLRP